jgi:hypothetical protein
MEVSEKIHGSGRFTPGEELLYPWGRVPRTEYSVSVYSLIY